MKRWGFSITLICGVLLACCTAHAQLEDLWKKAQTTTQSTNLPGMALSNDKIAGGLKEALTKSTGTAVASTGRVDGYFKNQAIKILLPRARVPWSRPSRCGRMPASNGEANVQQVTWRTALVSLAR